MHFPVYFVVVFLASRVTPRNYPYSEIHPDIPMKQLNLSYAHRHGSRGSAGDANRGGNENYSRVPQYNFRSRIDEIDTRENINAINKVDQNFNKSSGTTGVVNSLNRGGGSIQVRRNRFRPSVLRSYHRMHNFNSTHLHTGVHRHGGKGVNEESNVDVIEANRSVKGDVISAEMEKLTVVDASTGNQYNPFNKHQPGRHVCTKNTNKPVKTRQPYCKPTFKNYVIRCQGNQICKGVRLVYETHYKDVVTTKASNEIVYACCPGWTQNTNRNHGCRASCNKPCLNGGKCVKPDLCACLKGFAGQQCEIPVNTPECRKPCFNGGKCIKQDSCSCPKGFDGVQCENDLNIPQCTGGCENGGTCVQDEMCQCAIGFTGRRCERDIDECKELKPCDQICYNTPGSYNCQCKEDFMLQKDGQTCRKENDNGDGGLEAKDLEFELLDKRLLKLETMMDESHKNDVSKDDLKNVYLDMNTISADMNSLKTKINDVENYKNDMYIFKTKLSSVEKKAEKVDELMLKYDRMKKCAFYNKICM